MKTSLLRRVKDEAEIRRLIGGEIERTGGIFRLAPTWVGRPGIVQPGRRIKLLDDYMSQEVAVNERWLAYPELFEDQQAVEPEFKTCPLPLDSSSLALFGRAPYFGS